MENNFQHPDSQSQPELSINPRDLPWVGCEKGIQAFESAMVFKRLSPLLSPTGKEEMIPAEIVLCRTCGKAPKFVWEKLPDFPEELRSTCEQQK
jgi:hypothetical protein